MCYACCHLEINFLSLSSNIDITYSNNSLLWQLHPSLASLTHIMTNNTNVKIFFTFKNKLLTVSISSFFCISVNMHKSPFLQFYFIWIVTANCLLDSRHSSFGFSKVTTFIGFSDDTEDWTLCIFLFLPNSAWRTRYLDGHFYLGRVVESSKIWASFLYWVK